MRYCLIILLMNKMFVSMKGLAMEIKTVHQYGRVYSETPVRIRVASRAFLINDGKILLSHELNTGVYLIPGGGAEDDETAEECCVREIREETGYEVKPVEQILEIDEHFRNILYISRYFICEIIGKGEQKLTESEREHGVVPEWIEIEKALEIFGEYGKYADVDEEIEGQYRREYAAIKHYIEYTASAN